MVARHFRPPLSPATFARSAPTERPRPVPPISFRHYRKTRSPFFGAPFTISATTKGGFWMRVTFISTGVPPRLSIVSTVPAVGGGNEPLSINTNDGSSLTSVTVPTNCGTLAVARGGRFPPNQKRAAPHPLKRTTVTNNARKSRTRTNKEYIYTRTASRNTAQRNPPRQICHPASQCRPKKGRPDALGRSALPKFARILKPRGARISRMGRGRADFCNP